jgi:hypothetical protein
MNIPVMIYDNFFDDVNAVREYALSLNYTKHPGAIPGKRSDNIKHLNPELFLTFKTKLLDVLSIIDADIDAYFQLTPAHYEEGWVHVDNTGQDGEPTIAGVIYLTPNAPLEAGTSVYRETIKTGLVQINHDVKYRFYQDLEVSISEYRMERDRHNALYDKTLDVGNTYNRLFTYNTYQLHKENMFFGNTKEDSRMTLVFFAWSEDAVI